MVAVVLAGVCLTFLLLAGQAFCEAEAGYGPHENDAQYKVTTYREHVFGGKQIISEHIVTGRQLATDTARSFGWVYLGVSGFVVLVLVSHLRSKPRAD